MLNINLNPIFTARNIQRPYTFLVKLGISPTVAHKILNNDTHIFRLDHMNLICSALHCTPNDLLIYTPDKNKSMIETHPLNKLKPQFIENNWQETIKTIPLDKLTEISRLIKEI